MSALIRRIALISRAPVVSRALSTLSPELFEDAEVPVLDDDEALQKAKQLEKSRNKSRLSSEHFNIVNGRRPYPIDAPKSVTHLTVKYHRHMYGKYGSVSGVDPSLCWPSSQELAETKDYESVTYRHTIQQMAQQVLEKRHEKKRIIEEREASIVAKLEKLDQWKKEVNERLNKRINEVIAAKEKKERLVEEVRRHFGFKLDHRDERFQEMLAKREKEQKKMEKQARRDAKDKEILAKIQMKNAAIDIPNTQIPAQSNTE